jgi:hypothetical protein
MLEIKRILCPIDFSEFSARAYRHALSVAEHYRAKMVALHVVELWRYRSAEFAASLANYEEFCRALHEGGEQQLQEFVKNYAHDEIKTIFYPLNWLAISGISGYCSEVLKPLKSAIA